MVNSLVDYAYLGQLTAMNFNKETEIKSRIFLWIADS